MAPETEPIVAATIVPGTFIAVEMVNAPPNKSTASEGMGGKTFSIKISKWFYLK